MDNGQNNLLTLIFLIAAVLVFLKLRSVLGRRTGDEPARYERFRSERTAALDAKTSVQPATPGDGKIVTLPRRDRDPSGSVVAGQTHAERAHRMTQFAGGNSALARGLIDIATSDPQFEPADFLRGAKAAYEAIVMGFAEGNRARLRELLSDDVYEGFATALDDRAARQETVEQTFVGIKSADILEAELKDTAAMITVTFVSELTTAVRNAAQVVVSGDPKRVKEVTDIWTFARDVHAAGPNWHLIATRAATA